MNIFSSLMTFLFCLEKVATKQGAYDTRKAPPGFSVTDEPPLSKFGAYRASAVLRWNGKSPTQVTKKLLFALTKKLKRRA